MLSQVDKKWLFTAVAEWIKFNLDERKERFMQVLDKVELKLCQLPLHFLNNVVAVEVNYIDLIQIMIYKIVYLHLPL